MKTKWVHNPLILRTLEIILKDNPLDEDKLELYHFQKCWEFLSQNQTIEDKFKSIFQLFDVDGDDAISEEDITTFHKICTTGSLPPEINPFPKPMQDHNLPYRSIDELTRYMSMVEILLFFNLP